MLACKRPQLGQEKQFRHSFDKIAALNLVLSDRTILKTRFNIKQTSLLTNSLELE